MSVQSKPYAVDLWNKEIDELKKLPISDIHNNQMKDLFNSYAFKPFDSKDYVKVKSSTFKQISTESLTTLETKISDEIKLIQAKKKDTGKLTVNPQNRKENQQINKQLSHLQSKLKSFHKKIQKEKHVREKASITEKKTRIKAFNTLLKLTHNDKKVWYTIRENPELMKQFEEFGKNEVERNGGRFGLTSTHRGLYWHPVGRPPVPGSRKPLNTIKDIDSAMKSERSAILKKFYQYLYEKVTNNELRIGVLEPISKRTDLDVLQTQSLEKQIEQVLSKQQSSLAHKLKKLFT